KKNNLLYTIYDKHIVIYKKTYWNEQQQNKQITGTIVDEKGEPIIGANIKVKGTSTGTITDVDGKFSLNIPSNSILEISYIGYIAVEIPLDNQTTLAITLKEFAQDLDEVVVIGYGAIKKSDLTGSVSSVSKKALGDRVATDIGSLVLGKATGIEVSQGAIRIRGVTTLNNTDPLIVVDGFMGGSFNPNEIEHIEVLKDASSTAIYGSRGANGVILITTKSGQKGPLRMTTNLFSGFDFIPSRKSLLNASQYVDYATEAILNANGTLSPNLTDPKSRADVTDWQNVAFKTGHRSEANVHLSGGSDKALFSLSLGYRYSNPIVIGGDKKNNMDVRSKTTFHFTEWLKAGMNIALNYNTNYSGWTKMDAVFKALPYIPAYDQANIKGLGFGDTDTQLDGVGQDTPLPFAHLMDFKSHNFNMQPNIWFEIRLLKELVYRVQTGIDVSFGRRSEWHPDFYAGGGIQYFQSKLLNNHTYGLSPLIENYLTYSNQLGKHDFSIMVGNSWQNYVESGNLAATGSPFDDYTVKNLLFAKGSQVTEHRYNKYAYLSYYGRINYQFNNKYLLTANFRSDGSPKFAPNNRWAYFPSIALAWKLHEEGLIKTLNAFDQLKLRIGWGKSGNDSIGDFMYLAKVFNVNVFYPFGQNGEKVTGATVIQNATSDIKWETTISKTIGIDMAFFKNRLIATIDLFDKKTEDILFGVPIPPSMGYGTNNSDGSPIVNAASVKNKGFELMLGFQNNIGDLSLAINGNYTFVHNEVTSLGTGQPYLYSMNFAGGGQQAIARTEVGHPIGYFYGFIADGIFKTQNELNKANAEAQTQGHAYYQMGETKPGDVRYKDLDGDGQITWENDRTEIGSPIPKHYFGLNYTMGYKGFDLNLYLQGIAGSYIFNGIYAIRATTSLGNKDIYVLDRWKSEQEPGNGKVPRAVIGDPAQNNRPSTLMIEKADYFKIRQFSIGYTLP
ncbi:MAG: TonB-dependent receptor, partial [Prevotellaceae bacterium]|nr:TonB-dependent receptor [Prevotellaceae bacterium]